MSTLFPRQLVSYVCFYETIKKIMHYVTYCISQLTVCGTLGKQTKSTPSGYIVLGLKWEGANPSRFGLSSYSALFAPFD
jgi:hypothetical protein